MTSTSELFLDAGRGDWRLADHIPTRVTCAQVDAITRISDVESVGASDVRFNDCPGDLCVFHTDGRVSEIDINGKREEIAA